LSTTRVRLRGRGKYGLEKIRDFGKFWKLLDKPGKNNVRWMQAEKKGVIIAFKDEYFIIEQEYEDGI